MTDHADLIQGVLQREHPTALGDVLEVEQVDPSGAYVPPTSGGYTARAQVSVGIGTTDAAATFAATQKKVVVVVTAIAFVNFDAPAAAATAPASGTGFPLAANAPQTFDGPITSIHVIAAAAGGTLVAYGVS